MMKQAIATMIDNLERTGTLRGLGLVLFNARMSGVAGKAETLCPI
jgi:hypothetical protein